MPWRSNLINNIKLSSAVIFVIKNLDEAVHLANTKTKAQKFEGLYITTVPNHLRVVLAQPSLPGTQAKVPFTNIQVKEYLSRCATALTAGGFASHAEEIAWLASASTESDFEALEQRLGEIEREVVVLLGPLASTEEVEKELKTYGARMGPDERARLKQQFTEREQLRVAGIPRLSLFYV